MMESTNSKPKDLASAKTLGIDLQLCFALYSASLSMTKTYKPLLKNLNLTYPQYLVLLVLWEKEGLTVNSICERLFSDSGTITPLLKRLEKLGYVSRQRSAQDERKVIVNLTERAKALQLEAMQVQNNIVCSTGCTESELQVLNQQLISLRSHLIANQFV